MGDREREDLFHEAQKDKDRREKEERKAEKQRRVTAFKELLEKAEGIKVCMNGGCQGFAKQGRGFVWWLGEGRQAAVPYRHQRAVGEARGCQGVYARLLNSRWGGGGPACKAGKMKRPGGS